MGLLTVRKPIENKATTADEDDLWSPERLSRFLDIPVATIYRWRSTGEGPPGFRIGKHLRFAKADVLAWLETKRSEL